MMKRNCKGYLSALRALLATAAVAGLGWNSAWATVFAPLQLPGHGSVVYGSASANSHYGTGGAGTITVAGTHTVINWGNTGGAIGTNQVGGFNIGQSASLTIDNGPNALLNVDVTGTPSQILGGMNVTGMGGVFVANANGITVGPNATVTAPAGLGLIAATVNSAQFALNGDIPVSFASAGPLTVQGNLQGVGGFVLLAGSGAVNVSPVQSESGAYFKPGPVTVVGGVGGTWNAIPGTFVPGDTPGSPTPSATSPTTVTLNLGTSANPYDLNAGGSTIVLVNGSIVNNGVLTSSNATSSATPYLQWTGTLTNNGTINASLISPGTVTFNGNTSAPLLYGGLTNNGTIAVNGNGLFISLPGTILNNSGATISNVGGFVSLYAGKLYPYLGSTFLNVGGGAVINHGSVIAYDSVYMVAANPQHTGPNPGGGVYSDGSIQFLSGSAHTDSSLYVQSFTGNAFLGGSVTTPNDAAGLYHAGFESGRTPVGLFTLGTNVTADTAGFTGGSLTGSGTLTTSSLRLSDFLGNVNNVTGSNPLNNGFHLANGSFGNTAIRIDLPTNGDGAIGRQVVNLNVAGNATLTSHGTSTFVTGLGPAGILPTEANVMSNLLVQASGNLTVNPSGTGPENYALSNGALGTPGFVFPGGVVLIAGNTLTLNTVVDNGYAPTVVAGQGIFFQAPHIVTTAPVITNGNAWVNFSTAPSTVPAIYGVTPALSISPIAYTIVANPSAYHIRSYAP